MYTLLQVQTVATTVPAPVMMIQRLKGSSEQTQRTTALMLKSL